MRDLRKIRTKYEIRLDNRQIAMIAGGGLFVLLVIFALGVVVGKGLGRIEGMAEMKTPEPVSSADLLTSLPKDPKAPEAVPPISPAPTLPVAPDAASPYESQVPGGYVPAPPSGLTPPTAPPGVPPMEPPPVPDNEAPPVASESVPVVMDNLTPGGGGFYTVQVAAYPTSFEADTMKSKLEGKGLAPYIVKVEIPGKGTYFRVRVGKFSSKEGAISMASALKEKENLSPFVAYVK